MSLCRLFLLNQSIYPWIHSWESNDLAPGSSAYMNLSKFRCQTCLGMISYTDNGYNQNILFTVAYTNEINGNNGTKIFKVLQKTGANVDNSNLYIWGGDVILTNNGTTYPFQKIRAFMIGFN